MSKGLIDKNILIDIADAIREKTDSTDLIKPSQMASAVRGITGGGGGGSSITIYYNVDGTEFTERYNDGDDILKPATFSPIKEGYTFYGWALEPNGNKLIVVTPTQNMRLYALFLPTVTDFDYTGNMQTFLAKKGVKYKLEVWGAKGGDTSANKGGLGGYSSGYYTPAVDTNLYICCGGAGTNTKVNNVVAGGYNGGGNSNNSSGGGATHISLMPGILSSIGATDFITNKKGLIVAGGGGGCSNDASRGNGGSGGGLTGGDGVSPNGTTVYTTGGTQTAGGGNTGSGHVMGSFGQGASTSTGGGGGLYGGGGWYYSAGGGSGYIGGVETGSTSNGINSGDGKARISIASVNDIDAGVQLLEECGLTSGYHATRQSPSRYQTQTVRNWTVQHSGFMYLTIVCNQAPGTGYTYTCDFYKNGSKIDTYKLNNNGHFWYTYEMSVEAGDNFTITGGQEGNGAPLVGFYTIYSEKPS